MKRQKKYKRDYKGKASGKSRYAKKRSYLVALARRLGYWTFGFEINLKPWK